MKKLIAASRILVYCLVPLLCYQSLSAQGYGGPLSFHGVNKVTLHSAGSRGMGGITIGIPGDVGLMFHNPASLHAIQGIRVSIGGSQRFSDQQQIQHYAPVRYYPNLSLLLEGLTDQIPDPDPSRFGFTPMDTVQRPFDEIGPNWSRSSNKNVPVQAMLAAPFSVGDFRLVAGIGVVEYADLNHYFQNNNVLTPSVLSQRPLPLPRPTDNNPVVADWSQSIRSREGSIHGYGFAFAAAGSESPVSFGISGLLIRGSTDDFESRIGRGRLTFFSNAFRLDSTYSRITKTGASDYSGAEFTFSAIVSGRYASLGLAATLPATITRKFSERIETDVTGTPTISTVDGEDKLELPWRGRIGLSLQPAEKLSLGMEYELRPYESATYIDAGGQESGPWLSSSLFRIGFEYRFSPWFALRGGMRGEAEVFEPEGNHIEGEPVIYTVYTAGIGLNFSGIQLNMAYEYASMKYEDIWGSAISKNGDKRHILFATVSYEIPWISN